LTVYAVFPRDFSFAKTIDDVTPIVCISVVYISVKFGPILSNLDFYLFSERALNPNEQRTSFLD